MNDNFELWLKKEVDSLGLKDIKFSIGGDTSNASVEKCKQEVAHIERLANAGITEPFPQVVDYSFELTELNAKLNS